ncbi:hypothetical protein HNQ39_001611 [Armatimonas rosea]|uniref:Uncharacterized protein n=1 Tax=Armatimonas rosea TaxID=685828 RepID=A0A7W9SND6_ARMRO|nr:hypothetical protein [Armatimonas rosea]
MIIKIGIVEVYFVNNDGFKGMIFRNIFHIWIYLSRNYL